jgi:hypothetical protein
MNLSPDMQKVFTDEVHFVINKMRSTDSPKDKIYFFSAAHAMAQRVINLEYDPELNFIQQVLQLAYNTINARLSAISTGQQTDISIPASLFDKLEEKLEEMVGLIDEGLETYPALQKIANIAYITTGNGYYLYLKGMIKL